MPEPMRIKTIEVKGLFGRFNHTVNLNLAERVTILHGPNGVGKTVLLKMVQAVFSHPNAVRKVHFDSFVIEGTDGARLELVRDLKNLHVQSQPGAESSTIYRPPCHFIETQRLLRMTNSSSVGAMLISSTVRNCAKHLANHLQEHLSHYGRASQELDQTFPQRMVKKIGRPLSLEELKLRLQALEAKQKGFITLGLLDRTDQTSASPLDLSTLDSLDPADQRVMTLYVEDMEEKLKALDDVALRGKLLLDGLNQKFRHKHVVLNLTEGLYIEAEHQQIIDLSELSSGEQHELVLLYDLLFRVQPGSLVLIDEPELSLHVSWQKQFVPDLLAIAKAVGIDVVLATHSPFIVGDRLDLTVALDDGGQADVPA